MSHTMNRLLTTMRQNWAPADRNWRLENDGTRYWTVYDQHGSVVTSWESRHFPGNNSLVVTTSIELREDLRGRGHGKWFHNFRQKAYIAAGFVGEICTVRADSEAQTAIVAGAGAVCMATLPSEFGGKFNVWMLTLKAPAIQAPMQVPAPIIDTCGERRPYSYDTYCTKPLGHVRGEHSWVQELVPPEIMTYKSPNDIVTVVPVKPWHKPLEPKPWKKNV